jgi:hypothetical protein
MRSGEVEQALGLGCALGLIGSASRRVEHRDWVTALLDVAPSDHPLLCSLYAYASLWSSITGALDEAVRLARSGLAEAARCPEAFDVLMCWVALASSYISSARAAEALEVLGRAEALVAEDPLCLGAWLQAAYIVALGTDPVSARRYTARFIEFAAALDAPLWLAQATVAEGFNLLFDGRPGEALDACQEGVRLTEGTQCTARTTGLLGIACAAAELDFSEVVASALRELYEVHSWQQLWIALEYVGIHWVEAGRYAQGTAVLRHLDSQGRAALALSARRAATIAALATRPDTPGAARASAAMTREQLVGFVLAQLAG